MLRDVNWHISIHKPFYFYAAFYGFDHKIGKFKKFTQYGYGSTGEGWCIDWLWFRVAFSR